MKIKLLAGIVAAALVLNGCASVSDNVIAKAQADATQAQANARVEEARASVERSKADAVLYSRLDTSGAAGAAILRSLKDLGLGQGGQPQVVQVQQAARSPLAETVIGIAGFAKDILLGLAPAAAQVVIGNRQARTQEIVAGYNRDTQVATTNAFAATAASGFTSLQNTAGLGFAANATIAGHIPQAGPVTNYTVSGSNGVSTGGGTMTYNPITNSYNPTTTTTNTNPAPTVVTCTGTPPVCSR